MTGAGNDIDSRTMGLGLIAQGVTGGGVLEADHRVDVAGYGLVYRVLLVGVHLEELSDALLLALGCVEHLSARIDTTRVHADEGQLAEERVSSDLEGESRERLFLARLASDLYFFVTELVADDLADVQRVRQVIDDCVEHGLNALVLERGATDDRVQLGSDRHLADGALDFLDRELFAAEVLLHESFVDSATVSSSFSRYSAAFSTRSAGISSMVGSAPVGTTPRQVMARISTRSTTPSKSSSAPMGSWRTSGFAPKRSMMVWTVK